MTTTGFIFPTAGSPTEQSDGSTTRDWTNPDRIIASDNSRTVSAAISAALPNTYELVATGMDFSGVPAGSIIDGVEVKIEREASANNDIADLHVIIRKGAAGGTLSSDKADTSTTYTTNDVEVTYGSGSDLWGLTLSQSDLATLNILFSCQRLAGVSVTASVDAISVQITYHAAPSTGLPLQVASVG